MAEHFMANLQPKQSPSASITPGSVPPAEEKKAKVVAVLGSSRSSLQAATTRLTVRVATFRHSATSDSKFELVKEDRRHEKNHPRRTRDPSSSELANPRCSPLEMSELLTAENQLNV